MVELTRRALLRGAAALGGWELGGRGLGDWSGARPGLAAEVRFAPCTDAPATPAGAAASLADLARRQQRFFGCSVKDPLFTDAPFQQLVIEQCNLLVCTYSMKWRHVEREPGIFDFKRSDRYVAFADEHDMEIRGHTLIFEKELPPWFAAELAADGFAVLARHIRGVVGHYAGRLRSWDVVNEAIRPEDGRADRLRSNLFLDALGPSYIDAAFLMAREADPTALLYYNANPAPYRRVGDRAHFEGVITLLEGMIGRDVPVQGLGLQGHLSAALDHRFDEEILTWFFERAAELGLEIMITELDVTDKWLPADVSLRDERVAASYRRFLDIALSFPAVKGVLTWGLSDRYTGLNRWPRDDGQAVRGLPYDHCLQPKPARRAIAEAFLAHVPEPT